MSVNESQCIRLDAEAEQLSAFAERLKEIGVVAGRAIEDMVAQINQTVGSVLRPIVDAAWMFEEEACLREYARRMNAGPWRWRRQSWRRLNRQQRLDARQWWYSYGRKAMKGA